MKKTIFIFILIFFISNCNYSQSCWEKIIVDTTKNFNYVKLFNSGIGYIGGNDVSNNYKSCIYKTTNFGINWFAILAPSQHLYDMCFPNSSTGYVSTYTVGFPGYGYLRKTTNAGDDWYACAPPIYGGSFQNLYFYNGMIGWYSRYNRIYKTTSGGTYWEEIIMPSIYLYTITFIDLNKGFYLSYDNRVFKTTNGGYNWNQIFITNYKINDMAFSDSLNGYLVGKLSNGAILKTVNGGYNWNLIFSTSEELKKVTFINNNTGYVIGYSNFIYRTSNGGYNWESQKLDSLYDYLNFSFSDRYTGFITCNKGVIMKITNGGSVFVKNICSVVPSEYELEQNYPNPFNSMTNVKFKMLNGGEVKIVVYDLAGREVAVLVNEELKAGVYEVRFDAGDLPSGVYFYRMEAGSFMETRKLVLLK